MALSGSSRGTGTLLASSSEVHPFLSAGRPQSHVLDRIPAPGGDSYGNARGLLGLCASWQIPAKSDRSNRPVVPGAVLQLIEEGPDCHLLLFSPHRKVLSRSDMPVSRVLPRRCRLPALSGPCPIVTCPRPGFCRGGGGGGSARRGRQMPRWARAAGQPDRRFTPPPPAPRVPATAAPRSRRTGGRRWTAGRGAGPEAVAAFGPRPATAARSRLPGPCA